MRVPLLPILNRRGKKALGKPTAVLPNACPQCEGPGYLEYINLVRETKTQTCRECDFRWESPIS